MKTLGAWVGTSLLALGMVGGLAANAQTNTDDSSNYSYLNAFKSRWSIEGALQAHSVAGAASPWLGLGGEYRLLDPISLGIRGFLPMSKTVDASTYAIQGFGRARALHGSYTDVFFEGEYAENFDNLVPFSSYGASVGVMNRVTPGLSVGLLGGVELAHVVIDSVGLEDQSGVAVYPKVSVIANFNF